MTYLDERKSELLEIIIRDYIKTARPVASARLVSEYRLDMSPASVRSSMLELDRLEYLEQPHHASGRVPTMNGYRFFVDKIAASPLEHDLLKEHKTELKQGHDHIDAIARIIAEETQNLALGGWFERPESFRFFGLADMLRQPEFEDAAASADFVAAFEHLLSEEDELHELVEHTTPHELQVYIGEENPLKPLRDWSMILVRVQNQGDGVIAVIGPQRMSYGENMALVASLAKKMEELLNN